MAEERKYRQDEVKEIFELAANLFRLPRWAHQREGPMEYLEGRVGALLQRCRKARSREVEYQRG